MLGYEDAQKYYQKNSSSRLLVRDKTERFTWVFLNIYRNGFITNPCEFLKMADRNLVELEEREKKVLPVSFHEEVMCYAIDRCRSSSEDIQDFWNRTDKYYKIISEEKQKCYRKVS